MTERHLTPGKEEIALLEPFDRLGLDQIEVVSTPAQAASSAARAGRRHRAGL